MSQQNVEAVRHGAESFNAFMRGELPKEVYLQDFDPGFELHWHEQQTYPDTPRQLRGVQEFAAWVDEYRSAWADLSQEPLEIIEALDDRVVALIRLSGRGRESGVPIVIHYFEVISFRDGRWRKIEYFRHRAEALEAVGLRE